MILFGVRAIAAYTRAKKLSGHHEYKRSSFSLVIRRLCAVYLCAAKVYGCQLFRDNALKSRDARHTHASAN